MHANMAAGMLYFQRSRGEMDFDDDVADLKKILRKGWAAEMSSKKKWIQLSIDEISQAHNEFYDWTIDVGYKLESYLVDNMAVGSEQVLDWGRSLRTMVVDNHDRHADLHELSCMRSFDKLVEVAGLQIHTSYT